MMAKIMPTLAILIFQMNLRVLSSPFIKFLGNGKAYARY
jgi:hypothetical protein